MGSTYTQMRQVLESRQVGELQEERIDDEPAPGACEDEEGPQKANGNVVKEDQIVYDREK